MVDINIYVSSAGRFHRKAAKYEFFFFSLLGLLQEDVLSFFNSSRGN
jgi:hypothetical protein